MLAWDSAVAFGTRFSQRTVYFNCVRSLIFTIRRRHCTESRNHSVSFNVYLWHADPPCGRNMKFTAG